MERAKIESRTSEIAKPDLEEANRGEGTDQAAAETDKLVGND